MATQDAFQEQIDHLQGQINVLVQQVEGLSKRVGSVGAEPVPAPQSLSGASDNIRVDHDLKPIPSGSGSIWSWVGKSSLLPRVAAVCFILVVALLLRAITDMGMIHKMSGSILGMGYAGSLMAAGWWLLSRRNRVGPVFPVSGALLMFVIVLETHIHFQSISSVTAYVFLLLTLLAVVLTGWKYNQATAVWIGILGTSAVAMAIDFPEPYFPVLLFILLLVNIMSYLGSDRPINSEWSRWVLTLFTIIAWFLWVSKLTYIMKQGSEAPSFIAMNLYLPMVALYGVVYLAMTLRKAFGRGKQRLLDLMLPTIHALWLFGSVWMVVKTQPEQVALLGIVGVVLALVHFGVAVLIFKREIGGPGICSFTFAGSVYLVMASPFAVGNVLFVLPIWGAVAVILVGMSNVCEIGGIRLSSYMLQVGACLIGLLSGSFSVDAAFPVAGITITGMLALFSFFHYNWSRTHPISCSSGFFALFDPNDRTAVVLLVAALVNSFLMLQISVSLILPAMTADPGNGLVGAQSVLINIGAILLLLYSLWRKDKEIMGVAIAVVVLGMAKGVGYDLFKVHGVSLVISVFSLGVLAAVASVVLSRWQQRNQMTGATG